MTARKRKAPERKKAAVKEPGLLWQAVTAVCGLIGRQPRRIAGLICVCVGCSFVAANALWYQPENHPAPFLRTRDVHDPNAIAGFRPLQRQTDDDVTTFRIERARHVDDVRNLIASGDQPPASATPGSQAAESAVAAPAGESVEALIAQSNPPTAQTPPVHAPNATEAAAVPPAPLPAQVAVPRQRPSGNLGGEDPVAAAIRTAQQSPAPKPPADIPAISKANKAAQATPQPTRISATQTSGQMANPAQQATPTASVTDGMNMIMQIQRGLVNIAYTDVTVDGVAGAQTRAAIRHFQKHYRLPENGEPSELVLRKLKSIGAL